MNRRKNIKAPEMSGEKIIIMKRQKTITEKNIREIILPVLFSNPVKVRF
jgi:hypothetical protein